MIVRIVKLTFEKDKVSTFLNTFNHYKELIRNVEGCNHLKLMNDIHSPNVFMTYSYWESESHLNSYRKSPLFNEVWSKTKILFVDKPEAWSLNITNEVKI